MGLKVNIEGNDGSSSSDGQVPGMYSLDLDDDGKNVLLAGPNKEPFDIEDFTNASEWESFVSSIEEEVIGGWNLEKSFISEKSDGKDKPWKQEKLTLTYMSIQFTFVHYQKNSQELKKDINKKEERISYSNEFTKKYFDDLMDSNNDFFHKSIHPLNYYYGLTEFVVVSSLDPGTKIDNESKIKFLMSSLHLALNDTHCQVPFFVAGYKNMTKLFPGISKVNQFRTDYESVVLSSRPVAFKYLSGLIQMFIQKILQFSTGHRLVEVEDVRVSARLCYRLRNWRSHTWSKCYPNSKELLKIDFFSRLPFGCLSDPLSGLLLYCSWRDLCASVITDNNIHSDFIPQKAPEWSIRLYQEEVPNPLLVGYLKKVGELSKCTLTIKDILGDSAEDTVVKAVPTVLSKITGPTYSFSDIIQAGRERICSLGPLSEAHLGIFLDYLFPDRNTKSHPYPSLLTGHADTKIPELHDYRIPMSGIKSSPIDGLVWRLSLILTHIYNALDGTAGVAHFLNEFFIELRSRWELAILIPGVPDGPPDHSYCLFHQKIQMLNCCISKKAALDQESVKNLPQEDSPSEEEDEFFECEEENILSAWNVNPEGRLKKLGKNKLLKYDDYIYEPICQDQAPMTEDQLAEHAEVMLQLGFDAEGSAMRAKMQSASLLSDMEAFKAANPGCILEDFIRWHSPRDWNESTQSLSQRMTAVDGIWNETWQNAKSVPARKQRRLFNDTKEAEKVLNYLCNLSPGEVIQECFATIYHSAICSLLQKDGKGSVPFMNDIINETIQKLTFASRLHCEPEVKQYKSLNDCHLKSEFSKREGAYNNALQLISLAELKLSTLQSLQLKFKGQINLIKSLISSFQEEVKLEGGSSGPTGSLVKEMFLDAKKGETMNFDPDLETSAFPGHISKEFVLRVNAPRPYSFSKPSPQKMNIIMGYKEFRISGAFTTDTSYS